MISKRKKVLLRSVATAIALAALGAVVKMLVTDHWSSIDPLVSTAWTWTLAAFAWVAQPITAPLWILFVVLLLVVGAFVVLVTQAREIAGRLNACNAQLHPKIPRLNESTQKVLGIIARHSSRDEGVLLSKLPIMSGLSTLEYDGALDVLASMGLIYVSHEQWEAQVLLTPRGRAYVLHPDFPLKGVV